MLAAPATTQDAPMIAFTRRAFLARAALAAALAGRSVRADEAPALKALAAAKGLRFGAEVQRRELEQDPAYAELVPRQCALIVPGLEAKWDYIEPGDGSFDFSGTDWLLDFATRHGMAMRMHTLVWSLALPDWAEAAIADGRGAAILERHIRTVVGRYRGKVDSWDVANEVMDPRWRLGPEGLTLSHWRKALGPDYVERAFRWAHDADGNARLFINDAELETDEPDRELKRNKYLDMIGRWLARGVPVHGFGLQGHLDPSRRLAEEPYRRFLRALAGMGLTIYITELDVLDQKLPADVAERDRIVAETCRRYLDVALDEPAVKAVMTWGLSDRYTYMSQDPQSRRPDGLPSRCLPWDPALAPTPMARALAEAFEHAPAR